MPRKKKTKLKTEEEKSPSELLQDDIEPIWSMIDEGGPAHPTEHDESDDLEAAKKVVDAIIKPGSIKEKTLKGPTKKPKIRKSASKEEELNFLGEWLCQEHLMVELAYDPLKEHHSTRNNKLGPCDGKDPNGREVEIRTQKRTKTNFVIPKNDIEKCQTVERLIFVEYDHTNTIGIWECHDRSVNEKKKTFALPIKHMQLLLSFDNADYAEQMRKIK